MGGLGFTGSSVGGGHRGMTMVDRGIILDDVGFLLRSFRYPPPRFLPTAIYISGHITPSTTFKKKFHSRVLI